MKKILIINVQQKIDDVVKSLLRKSSSYKEYKIHKFEIYWDLNKCLNTTNYSLIAVDTSHPKGKTFLTRLMNKYINNEIESNIVEVDSHKKVTYHEKNAKKLAENPGLTHLNI